MSVPDSVNDTVTLVLVSGLYHVVLYDDAAGCETCLDKGCTDRISLFEMMVLKSDLRDMISRGESSNLILQKAREEGMQILFDHGLSLDRQGRVSLDEVIRMASS